MSERILVSQLSRIAALTGHTKPVAGRRLFELAKKVPQDQAIVEIGVFMGRSLCYLASGAKAGLGAHVWGVDPWDLPGERYPYHWLAERPTRHRFTKPETREQAEKNVAELKLDNVTLVRSLSVDAGKVWENPEIGLLHVDGDHRYEAVMGDWEAWSPHLAKGAVVCFDDHVKTCPDVMTAVAEIVASGELSPPIQVTRRLAVTTSQL